MLSCMAPAQSPKDPVVRLGAAIQPHSTDQKTETHRGYILFKVKKLKRGETGC